MGLTIFLNLGKCYDYDVNTTVVMMNVMVVGGIPSGSSGGERKRGTNVCETQIKESCDTKNSALFQLS